jgi:mannose-6-phosphate isomerase-like protein (cupin superfamily)
MVKRLHVHAGCRLSYQKHRFRSEHWTVVAGTARCTVDGQAHVLVAGASIDVPLGAKHRLANEGSEELVVLEVQCGAYTGEDDILRFEDDYGRHRAGSVG